MAFNSYGCAANLRRGTLMVSLRALSRQPTLTAYLLLLPPAYRAAWGLVGPGFAAPERKIVGVGRLGANRVFRLDNLIGNALAFAVSDCLLPGTEAERHLLLHVPGGRPAHQRLDRARLLRFIVEPPFVGGSLPRLHRVFGRLEDAGSHGCSGAPKVMRHEALGGNGRDSIETPLRNFISDSMLGVLFSALV